MGCCIDSVVAVDDDITKIDGITLGDYLSAFTVDRHHLRCEIARAIAITNFYGQSARFVVDHTIRTGRTSKFESYGAIVCIERNAMSGKILATGYMDVVEVHH